MARRRPLWVVAFVAALLGAAVCALLVSGPALAHHSYPATYTGTHSGGGAVDFDVSADGSAITRFRAMDVPASNGCSFPSTEANGTFAITDHAFSRSSGTFPFSGTFPSSQAASGSLTVANSGVPCTSGSLSWTATTTADPPPQCNDGGDNDGDNDVDFPADPGCTSASDNDETDPPPTPQCSDGGDNDGDGFIDLADPGCSSPSDDDEFDVIQSPQCSDGTDNDGDGFVDLADPGCSSPSDGDEFDGSQPPAQCSDGADNDGDGLTDMADPGCFAPSDIDEFNFPSQSASPTPTPAPTPGPTPSPSPVALDLRVTRTLPLLTSLSRGIPLTLSCPRACRASATALLNRTIAKRLGIVSATVVVGKGSAGLGAAGQRTLAVKFTTKARRRLQRVKTVALAIRTKVTDSTGSKTFGRKVTLSRSVRANRPPIFPSPMRNTVTTNFEYDPAGRLSGGTTTITIESPATDPDGDPLTYSWTASVGSISATGLTAKWTRIVDTGRLSAGEVQVTVKDGRGGTDTFTFEFQRGA